jgi:hypothetical protein
MVEVLLLPLRIPAWLLFIPVFIIGVPISWIVWFVARKHCPKCNRRSLSGHFVGRREDPHGYCSKCRAEFRYRNRAWEYIGTDVDWSDYE